MMIAPPHKIGDVGRVAVEHGQSLARSTRLAQMQHLLHKNPRGLTTRELANLCGVCVRTIQRDLLTLQSDLGVPVTQEGDRYGVIDSYILPPLSFSLYEAMALFLACRLAFRQTDENNPHMKEALAKMASVLPQPLGHQLKEGIETITGKFANPAYVRIFEQVAIAWSTQRQMRIWYQSLASQDVKEWTLEPYFVETTGVGYSVYVIGQARREGKEGIITFKLDRIKEARLLEESFHVPDGLSLEKLLGAAWGIIWGEETEVKLRFTPNVARRVRESVWHISQKIADLSDGSILLTLRIGSTTEVAPWIRGWGPDVEVLEPDSLRQQLAQWAKELNQMYNSEVGVDGTCTPEENR